MGVKVEASGETAYPVPSRVSQETKSRAMDIIDGSMADVIIHYNGGKPKQTIKFSSNSSLLINLRAIVLRGVLILSSLFSSPPHPYAAISARPGCGFSPAPGAPSRAQLNAPDGYWQPRFASHCPRHSCLLFAHTLCCKDCNTQWFAGVAGWPSLLVRCF